MSNLYEYIKMAVHNIMANKGRSFLTMLGIIIGIYSQENIFIRIINAYCCWNDRRSFFILHRNMTHFCYSTLINIITGISSEDYVEITEGIKEGEEVIADLGDYTEGMEVQAVPEQTGEDADE